MRERYVEFMERVLSAYPDEHILRYFDEVKTNGLTEHGFPRLTANIGILIAHGRRRDLLPVFTEMMDFCCKAMISVKAANDFSVREIVCCLLEIERSKAVPAEKTQAWRADLAQIEPTKCYDKYATSLSDSVRNWALFTAVSEYFRLDAGIGGDMEFIELQLGQQLQWLDENGMYRDNAKEENHQPIVYDLVPRGLFVLLLSRGYHGKYYAQIDDALKKTALLMLDMQSPNGELPFGGRSNQFIHNEPWMITMFEYEARRYAGEGNALLASKFKAASARAFAVTEAWLAKDPLRHIKNRFATETKYGCERYAYFDKYMITAASFLWTAYMICDDSIPYEPTADHAPCTAQTSWYFHKLFLKAGGYGLEFDLNADPHYDATGLGRVHRECAPSALCLSCPCPAKPGYTVDLESPIAFSLCSAVDENGEWRLGADEGNFCEVMESSTEGEAAFAKIRCRFKNGQVMTESYSVDANGVTVMVKGEGKIGFALPAFAFDGEKSTEIACDEHTLSVTYDGWCCRYTTDGAIADLKKMTANRNGHYRAFLAAAEKELSVKIELVKM